MVSLQIYPVNPSHARPPTQHSPAQVAEHGVVDTTLLLAVLPSTHSIIVELHLLMQDYDSLGNDDVPYHRMMTICQRQIRHDSMMMQVWRTRRHTLESLVLNEVQDDSTER